MNDGRQVAVTGASGFVGRAVCKRLTSEGYSVVRVGRADRDPCRRQRDRKAKVVVVAEDVVQFRGGIEEGMEQGSARRVEQIGRARVQRGRIVIDRRNERAIAEQRRVGAPRRR